MNFYRYEWVQYASMSDEENIYNKIPNPTLNLHTLNLYKETKKGYWIGFGKYWGGSLRSECHWVSKTARKRYAYPTQKEALHNFICRTEKRIKILSNTVACCKIAVNKAKGLKNELR